LNVGFGGQTLIWRGRAVANCFLISKLLQLNSSRTLKIVISAGNAEIQIAGIARSLPSMALDACFPAGTTDSFGLAEAA